jgi:hypothetical protein
MENCLRPKDKQEKKSGKNKEKAGKTETVGENRKCRGCKGSQRDALDDANQHELNIERDFIQFSHRVIVA